jgi:hypothetical protein
LAMPSVVLAKVVVIFSSVANNFSSSVWLMTFFHSNRGETCLENFIKKTWNNSGGLYTNGRIGLTFAIIILIIIIIIIIITSLQFQEIHFGKERHWKDFNM